MIRRVAAALRRLASALEALDPPAPVAASVTPCQDAARALCSEIETARAHRTLREAFGARAAGAIVTRHVIN